MKFQKLRLVGFKSFVEPTEFVIEPGLTGVVGPNGCGKSNLVEALRWVMGEASYKNMRASAMDDVIFSGSQNRPSRNFAEVGLHLLNADRRAPAAFNDADELQVTRRIEREAGSVYRINGRDVRARDVQLLFADVSTGARSPSMIGQGRVAELIAAKPQARRALLEEAAGISGLHTRRHEAELRLKNTETNLEQLDALIAQLDTQLEGLRRQARQATRFRNLATEIRRAEATILYARWTAAREAAREADSAMTRATVATAEAGLRQAEAARQAALIAHDLPALREAEAAEAAALQHVRIRRDQLDREQEQAVARRAELEARIQQGAADLAREERMVGENAEVLERLAEERETLAAQTAGADDALSEAEATFEAARQEAQVVDARAEAATTRAAEAGAGAAQIERAAKEARARADRLAAQHERVAGDLAALERRIEEEAALGPKREAVEMAERDLREAEEAAVATERALEQAREAEAAARGPLADARTAVSALDTEAKTLAGLLADGEGRATPVLDEMQVEEGYERALAAALGADLDVSRDTDAPAFWGGADSRGDPLLPSGTRPLAAAVWAPDELRRRLAQVGVVSDASERMLDELQPGQTLVSLRGAVWRWDGLRVRADAVTPGAQRLESRNRLKAVKGEREGAKATLAEAAAAHAAAHAALGAATDAERDARSRARTARAALDTARGTLTKAERETGEATAKRDGLRESAARLLEERDAAREMADEAETSLAALPDVSAAQKEADEARRAAAAARTEAAEARAALDAARGAGNARDQRLAAIEREADRWRKRAEGAEAQIAALRGRREAAESELQGLDAEPDRFEARRREVLTAVGDAEERRTAAADRLQERENALAEADRAARDTLNALAEHKAAVARAEERHAAARERQGDLEARIRQVLDREPHQAFAETGLDEGATIDVDGVERRLERLRAERERLGAVNLRAELEAEEVGERHGELARERDDLLEAVAKLRTGIAQLNGEGRERLLEAFGKVKGEFTRLFTHLFGGGTAELQMVESDDPLEAGLEIVARPPGKKPQVMTLLSGGEQALTALALIFAVFLTNPAPICVLDEVDAPLDDANVGRFCNLMDEMAAATETRFVIITHNPITMARMDRLFGVTMAEQGVSQLVSVDLQTAEGFAEAS